MLFSSEYVLNVLHVVRNCSVCQPPTSTCLGRRAMGLDSATVTWTFV